MRFAPMPGQGVMTAPPQSTVTIVTHQLAPGQCPTCQAGVLVDDFTCCGITMAICFFPIGILCCLAMQEKKCSNCGSTFS
ncbi:unnamed protein product [Darwinula stevensoni]|uniref:Membrane protein BRI3 n=1 Tax=Darwinula stevensoni TaxID=69355 RepID=A0A7R8X1Z8_9CRUS|nr:unnamed protein product [Darwinula stevensoni]CAG0882802.1 unnamed protein product [Darwinula stevensoni]